MRNKCLLFKPPSLCVVLRWSSSSWRRVLWTRFLPPIIVSSLRIGLAWILSSPLFLCHHFLTMDVRELTGSGFLFFFSIVFIKENWSTRTDKGSFLQDRLSFTNEIFMMTRCLAIVTTPACKGRRETQGGVSPRDSAKRKTSLTNTASPSPMKFLVSGKENVYWGSGHVGWNYLIAGGE